MTLPALLRLFDQKSSGRGCSIVSDEPHSVGTDGGVGGGIRGWDIPCGTTGADSGGGDAGVRIGEAIWNGSDSALAGE